ncbi:MAG: LytTR family transcriptional regulator [Lachnospiraceae bacterium]|nr:LytTR family transcriptional regulator [Lachnospiraceae bacterium]MDE6625215.1 LytTR family transcriptional regulator [Lachnospiraceae bacterium]
MKIEIKEDMSCEEPQIQIICHHMDSSVLKILAMLQAFDRKITGIKDGETYLLEADKILYIDVADKKTFFYTADAVYETLFRLYELEERLEPVDFIRVSKSALVNFARIKSLRPDMGGRMRLTMENGEVVIASRQYVPVIKGKLGI